MTGIDRIALAFASHDRRAALMPYLMGGFPDLDASRDVGLACVDAGADLVELGDYQCYARLSSGGERLPAFHLRLDAPPVADAVIRDLVAAASGTRYGRDAAVVADDRVAMLERLEVQAWSESSHESGRSNTDPEGGRIPPASAGTVMGPQSSSDGQKRNQQRPARSSEAGRATGTPQLKLDLHTQPAQAAGTGGPEHHEEGAPGKDEVA